MVPSLYVLCYRRTLATKALFLRMIGLACLGIFVASKLVPAATQTLLPYLTWPRTAGLAVLALVELKLMIELIRLVFGGKGSTTEIAKRTGAPPALVRLMALEARFWKSVWRFVLRRPR